MTCPQIIIEKAIEEIEFKNFGLTEQFLEIHKIVYTGNKPKISRVDTEKDNIAIVYFPVVDQKFYFAVGLQIQPEVSVIFVQTEPYISVCFRASSDTLNRIDLTSMTVLKISKEIKKGKIVTSAGRKDRDYVTSIIIIEPNPEADEFEDKLSKLLDYLEQDVTGVTNLVNNANGYIQVAMEFHNGNTMIGGPHISKEHLKRMKSFNLDIDFDLYVSGDFFRS